ncbi:MAG: hypothetical protein A3C36_04030 [Omnitrophica WOR_2 bacterium RIFCSPHIGHO2_02_FULL_52_10]|nr:MAG: hypothetical protein A3C36_04030 [Omnitrophica WOR_2 bacterium RIFCSPHIGHO2_02_FULL_52_10]
MTEKARDKRYYFEQLGDDFEAFISDYDATRRIELIFQRLVPRASVVPDMTVLEVGCGTGRISREIRKRPWKLTVNDISEKLCRQVAGELDCQFLAGDGTHLPCANGAYDMIISSECLEHTFGPWAVMAELKRALKAGGSLIVTTPNKLWYPALLVAKAMNMRKFAGIERWTWPWSMRRWLRQSKFADIHFDGCHLLPWQLPLAKRILPFFDCGGKYLYPLMINYGFYARKIL